MHYTYEYPRPTVTVDSVVIQANNMIELEVLLIKRGNPPFKGKWALPGGFLDMGESPLLAASRELEEETKLLDLPLKPVFACGEVGRDPRARCITMVFGCLVKELSQAPVGSDDAVEAQWFSLFELPEMAFDHLRILNQIQESLYWQARTAIIGQNIFEKPFNENSLRAVYTGLFNCNYDEDFITRALKLNLITKESEGMYSFCRNKPIGPDWVRLVW